ncbi:hypothetical protein FPZ12_015070 [Amycolatopsis acidicola]|uniref:Uncharacterized protein n=1 Tax=Amycolatopsis acidicola TaxID=2596893 RepID=A0A5N0V7A5_9PSEU|nr:hypothetical protein [Amycolatopsis acidicola]KAA9161083.1 hypothetical protein FPZ12_015070 [Amycolatopsis acidicola]
MDEKELAELFRSAPGEPPAPRFSLDSVKSGSARAKARRNQFALLVTTCLVLLLGTAGVVGLTYFRGGESSSAQPANAPERPPGILSAPSASQGTAGTGEDGHSADSTSGCDKVDRELATALAGELPATGRTGPFPGQVCVTGARSAEFHVQQGFVTAALIPRGTAVPAASEPGSAVAQQRAAISGGTIVVISVPGPGGTAPLADQLTRIAADLAAHF